MVGRNGRTVKGRWKASVILTRLKYGWDIEKILTTPTQIKNRGGKK